MNISQNSQQANSLKQQQQMQVQQLLLQQQQQLQSLLAQQQQQQQKEIEVTQPGRYERIVPPHVQEQYAAFPTLMQQIVEKIGDFFVLKEVTRGERIGSGNFGDVYIGNWGTYGKKIALKCLKPEKTDNEAFIREVQVSLYLNSPSIVRCFGVAACAGDLHLVLEYCSNGSLLDYLKKNGNK